MKKLLALLLFFPSVCWGAQTVIPTTCYVGRQKILTASTVSVRVASSANDISCWVIQNKDGTNSVFATINASTPDQGFEIETDHVLQLYTLPNNFLYLRSSTGSINVHLFEGVAK